MATFCDISGCPNLSFRTDKNTRKHYCSNHWKQHSTDIDRRSITQKALSRGKVEKIQKEPRFKRNGTFYESVIPEFKENEDKVKKAEMDLFWLTAEKELANNPYCAECGSFIPKQYYRAATAHVLQKRKEYGFPSIAANPLNRLFLGAGCGCHHRYDRTWEDAAQMKVFPQAIEIFKKLYPLIAKSERKNIPEVLMQEIEP